MKYNIFCVFDILDSNPISISIKRLPLIPIQNLISNLNSVKLPLPVPSFTEIND